MYASKLTLLTLVATYLLILAGGIVHATGSSLACPDWPLCYGTAFPAMAGGVFYEHSHRLLASAVGAAMLVLTLLLLFGRWGRQPRMLALGIGTLALQALQAVLMTLAVSGTRPSDADPMKAATPPTQILSVAWLIMFGITVLLTLMAPAKDKTPAVALMALEMLILQALLGGVTVVMRLPPIVSTAHLATSLLFFVTLLYLALSLWAERDGPAQRAVEAATAPTPPTPTPTAASADVPRGPIALAVVGVYLECVLGGLVRHTGAGMACGDTLFTCAGTLLPHAGPGHVNFTHRIFALLVAVLVIMTTSHALRQLSEAPDGRNPAARFFGRAAYVLAILQILVGLLMLATHLPTPITVAHLAVAALLLADLTALFVALGPLGARLRLRARISTAPAHLPT